MKDTPIFKTLINGEVCEIWNRKEEHKLGEWNGCPTTWWAKVDDEWIPWIDTGSNRPCFEIKIKQGNHTKYKWDHISINGTGYVEISINNQVVYTFGFNPLEYAFSRAQLLTMEMLEHPFEFSWPEKELGRKIWYYGQPAIIESLVLDQGCIMIQHAENKGFNLRQPYNTEEDIEMNGWNGEPLIKDDIFSPNIYWFRD